MPQRRRTLEDAESLADEAATLLDELQVEGDPDHDLKASRALELATRGRRIAERGGDGALASELLYLEATALSQLHRYSEAIPRFEALLVTNPDDFDVLLERAYALFETCRFPDARSDLLRALAQVPDDAWAHHLLGLVAERLGDPNEASRRFARAHELAPEEFPVPVELSPDEFDAVVEDALRGLPVQVRDYLANVAITVEDVPSDDDLTASDPPLSPSLLGVFRGSPLGDKASMDPWSHFPSSIVLFQRNLERFAVDREALVDETRITLLHEVGHFLGLDEEQLRSLGLD